MDTKFEEAYLARIWESYTTVELYRKKSFNQTFLTIALVTLLWITPSNDIKLPILGNELSIFLTLSLAPYFIVFLTSRYFYLSALAFNSFIEFIRAFQKFHEKELKRSSITMATLYNNFRIRDISETLNLFTFPRQFEYKFKFSVGILFHYFSIIGHRFVTLLTFLIPLFYATATTIWFSKIFGQHLKEYEGVLIVISYVFVHLILLVLLAYLLVRTNEARKYYKQEIVKVNNTK